MFPARSRSERASKLCRPGGFALSVAARHLYETRAGRARVSCFDRPKPSMDTSSKSLSTKAAPSKPKLRRRGSAVSAQSVLEVTPHEDDRIPPASDLAEAGRAAAESSAAESSAAESAMAEATASPLSESASAESPPSESAVPESTTAESATSDSAAAAPEPERRLSGLKLATLVHGQSLPPDAPASPHNPLIGCIIDGRYKIESVLGEGGMGVVFRGSHTIIGKKIAIKLLRADLARDHEATERFLNEAKAASAVGNPHIIDISDFGQLPDGSTYLVMEFLEGVPLSSVLESERPLSIERIVHIAEQLGVGLAAAHEAGIVHRDLKPDNIFLVDRSGTKDFVKILDFGIAKMTNSDGNITRAGAVFGTPHYMSPEQAAGSPVDKRGDIYAFGVILYELVSGKVPFEAENFMAILTQHMYKAPTPLRTLRPQADRASLALEAITLKCMAKRPEQRYQSMAPLLADLAKLKRGAVPDAMTAGMSGGSSASSPAEAWLPDYFNLGSPPTSNPAKRQKPRGKRWLLYIGVLGGIAGIGLGFVALKLTHPLSPEPGASSATVLRPRARPNAAVSTLSVPPPVSSASTALEPSAPKPRQVILAVEPLDAHIHRGDTDLGTSPILLEIAPNTEVELEIRRRGYYTERISLDGSQQRESVRLRRIVVQRRAPAKKTNKAAKQKPVGVQIVDPWE